MSEKQYLKYKNFIGSVEYNSADECYYGNILYIDDLVAYDGKNIEELENAFHEMVDDYLVTCKELGKKECLI